MGRHLANPKVGEVRVAAGDATAAGLLAPVIDRLSRSHPEISIRVEAASAEPLGYPELRERRVDLVLARISKSFAQADLEAEILFDDPSRVAVGLSSPWARRRKVTLAELVNETWTLTSDQVIRGLITEAFESQGLQAPREKVSASSMLLRSRLLATGRYLTVLPDSVLRSNAKQWSIKALRVDLGMKPMSVMIVTLKDRTLSPVVRLFMDQAREIAQTMSQPLRREAARSVVPASSDACPPQGPLHSLTTTIIFFVDFVNDLRVGVDHFACLTARNSLRKSACPLR